ncbi:MAG: OmpA family protein [bacterium]|nr:OmpA family protein [bacterium]
MKSWRIRSCGLVLCLTFATLTLGGNFTRAEEPAFPKTKEELRNKLFEQAIPENIDIDVTEVQESGQRGLQGIVDDGSMEKLPRIAALILFDFNSAKITDKDSLEWLKMLGELLVEQQGTVLIVAGHTDSKGKERYNLKLSKARAKSVRKFLSDRYGIAPQRLVITAYGENKPIASNETSAGRAKNRRVEFARLK